MILVCHVYHCFGGFLSVLAFAFAVFLSATGVVSTNGPSTVFLVSVSVVAAARAAFGVTVTLIIDFLSSCLVTLIVRGVLFFLVILHVFGLLGVFLVFVTVSVFSLLVIFLALLTSDCVCLCRLRSCPCLFNRTLFLLLYDQQTSQSLFSS